MKDDLTVGEWLYLFDRDPNAAWTRLDRACRNRVAGLSSRLRRTAVEPDDLVSGVLVRTFADDASAPRRASPDIALEGWIHGVLRNIVRETRRERSHAPIRSDEAARSATREIRRTDLDLSVLTTKQAQALELYRDGCSIAEIARRLHVSWSAVKDRLVRGLSRARTRTPLVPASRSWASGLRPKDPQSAGILELYLRGAPHREIAQTLGMTRDAVRSRLRRMRPNRGNRTRRRPPPCERDTFPQTSSRAEGLVDLRCA